MAVRAKFFVKQILNIHQPSSTETCAEVTMSPVYGDCAENADWSKHTPSGELKMMITNEDAVGQLNLGSEYYLDITPVKMSIEDYL